jgi:hypothetical protein
VAQSPRNTIVAHGRHAVRALRLNAARERNHGLQVMTFEQLAARLAGGFAQLIDKETLRAVVQRCLPETDLGGELDAIKALPGLVGAAADTLYKSWRAGIDLSARAGEHSRIASIASLETAVVKALPPGMKRPADLASAALQRLSHAYALFGSLEIVGITELSPCWRPLLHTLAEHVPVRWNAGPRSIPRWLDRERIAVVSAAALMPKIAAVSTASAYHEVIESLRWARQLVASGQADPSEIAFASVAPSEYDDYFLALREDSNLALHFVHGLKVTETREGQAAAALADILLRGLSQSRMRRLSSLLRAYSGPFKDLPDNWTRILPGEAALTSIESWDRLIDCLTASDWPDGVDHNAGLREIVSLLGQGISAAETAGSRLLSGRAEAIWRRALLNGPVASLDLTLETLRNDDGLDACTSVAWMPANELAASPRRFVRLLGLNSSRWPRGISEDRLLSDHIIPTVELDPLPVGAADQRDFVTILATTECTVVLSRSRRDGDGRLLGRSRLLQGRGEETYLRRGGVPQHAFSETDRLMARPHEFRSHPQALAASGCWRDWACQAITAHDGLVRKDHPLIQSILNRTQSASSLQQLLRNPLGFVWHYGLRWKATESGEEPLMLDPLSFGDLVHMILDRALTSIEGNVGLAAATTDQIAAAVNDAAQTVTLAWEAEHSVPPRIIWQRTLADIRDISRQALEFGRDARPGFCAYSEVPFGGLEPGTSDGAPDGAPWNSNAVVEVPLTGFSIRGSIDRLDITSDRTRAFVTDYKTGKTPPRDFDLDGGSQLQRCLYAFAVKALLGEQVDVTASLLYVRDQQEFTLSDPEATLLELAGYLRAARENLNAGGSVIGVDAGGDYDDLAFALPANAQAAYCDRKMSAAKNHLGAAAQIWEAK